jgi:hypothetical protein
MKKVKAGQAVDFKATEWNQIVDATNYVNQTRARGGQAIERSRNYLVNGSDIILGVNNTGATISQFDAVALGDPTPDTNNSEWHQKIAVNVDWPTGNRCENLAIAQEGIAAGEFGRIMVSGISPAHVTRSDVDDDLAVGQAGSGTLKSRGTTQSGNPGGFGCKLLYSDGSDWALVSVGSFASCHATQYLGTLSDAITSSTSTIDVGSLSAMNGKSTLATTLNASNHFSWEASSGAKCLIHYNDNSETWVLVQVECP